MTTTTSHVMRFDRGELASPTRTPQGFLRAEGYVSRPGIYEYRNDDGSIRRELRPDSEVSAGKALAGFAAAPITIGHPRDAKGEGIKVTKDNVKLYEVGSVDGSARLDGDRVVATLVVKDAKAIKAVESGKQELSPGYSIDLDERPGVDPKYGRYDAVQRNIVVNHLAIVDHARGGSSMRLRMDEELHETTRLDSYDRAQAIDALLKAGIKRVRDVDGKDYRVQEASGPALFGALIKLLFAQRNAGASPEAARADAVSREDAIAFVREHNPVANEGLDDKSDHYVYARYRSLRDLVESKRAARSKAATRQDMASVIRLDAKLAPGDLPAARMRVAYSGVPEADHERVASQLAYCAAWQRSADNLVARRVQERLDGPLPTATEDDLRAARRELEPSIPLDPEARADAFAAQAHEAKIAARARELAREREAAELQRELRAMLPDPPAEPVLPMPALTNARGAG